MRPCLHDWASVARALNLPVGSLPDVYVCRRCGCEGRGWYDMLSGGIDRTRRGPPLTDLRLQARLEGTICP